MSYSNVQSRAGINDHTYDNTPNAQVGTASRSDPGFWKNFSNAFIGAFNGDERFAATYSRLMHAQIALDDAQFAQQNSEQVKVNVTITVDFNHDINTSGRVPTALLDYAVIPKLNDMFGNIFSSGIFQIVDGILSMCGQRTIHDTMANLW